ncbi:cadherin-like domain-containing protein [Pseudochelatococcus contaminans]|uniref:VCBS repeat-containing protein n=1 Tax=Pseudochelatococcus contaminans TaxID=1538103 RepID=A0A7W6EEG2_9HYPH|nr:cadherin-like domain-containing protein [Pseudochelatococcus contaminans]MBB3808176.1 VCBS repeat-containing protein [Pseudochelatococcus contaminans]
MKRENGFGGIAARKRRAGDGNASASNLKNAEASCIQVPSLVQGPVVVARPIPARSPALACTSGTVLTPGLALALEPRFMFDAAGVATGATVAADADASSRQQNTGAADTAGDATAADAGVADTPADVGPFGSKAEAQLIQAQSSNDTPVADIVFVDARVPDIDALQARSGVEVVILDPARDGISQVNAALAGYEGSLSSIQFISHGENGAFGVGGTTVNAATLADRGAEIARWATALTSDADILIWGCDVAGNASGQALINSLATLTGADVAASTDTTGAQLLGGDWDLEARTGTIETALPFEAAALAAWGHALDTPTITGPEGTLRVAEPSALNTAGADRVSLADWQLTSAKAGDQFTVSAIVADTDVGALTDAGGQGTAVNGGFTFTGTLDQVNGWLDQLVFAAADTELGATSAATTLTLTVTNLSDEANPSSSRAINVEVTPSNDPVAVNDGALTVVEGSIGTVVTPDALNAIDPEVLKGSQHNAQIVYRLDAEPAHGYLTLGGTRIGSGSVFTQKDVVDGKLKYIHTAKGSLQNTADSFSVLVNDGATPIDLSDTATVAITITPVNQAPSIGGSGAIYEGQPANATVNGVPQSVVGQFITASGGGDPQDTADALSVRLTSLAGHGTLYFSGTATIDGVDQMLDNHAITQDDINRGFTFAYSDRGGLTYANNGVDDPATRRPPADSFGVEVIDAGGGTGVPATAAGTISLNIRAVNDEPVWVETSTRTATVDNSFIVPLTAAMLNATDVDSADANITFLVTEQSQLDQGRLVLDNGGTKTFIPAGGTFTLADVKAGRVSYYQLAGAKAGDTDAFTFQVLDNAVSPHWDASGNQFERPGGIYNGPLPTDKLRDFTFTINLQETPTGTGVGGGIDDPTRAISTISSNYAGQKPGDVTRGHLQEGGTVTLGDGSGTNPGLSYTADGVTPEQVVYTIRGFEGGDFGGWNGSLQKQVDGGGWVALDVYDTFTQADLNKGRVRYVHNGGEDFESRVNLRASAGILVDDGAGGLTPDEWNTGFTFYVTPVNDAPVATGSSTNVIAEGSSLALTTAHLRINDADDATSEAYLEDSETLQGGGDNFAYNNGDLLTFQLSELPTHGHLEFRDDSGNWQSVTLSTVLQANWITGDSATTRLRYVHDGGEGTTDSIKVRATDRWGATSDIATVSFVTIPKNDPPQIANLPTAADPVLPAGETAPDAVTGPAANNPLLLPYEGAFSQITAAMLHAVDPDSTAEQVQYRITAAPAHGRIAYSTDGVRFTTIAVGSSFTQADVDAGRIYYLHNGDESANSAYPNAPDDKFVFTLSDGAAEQTGNEFWIYVQPANDPPRVNAPTGPVPVADTPTALPGFSVTDPDLTQVVSGEQDFLQVVVRLLDKNGNPFSATDYAGATIGYAASGVVVVDGKAGAGDYLVLQGTRAQINGALAGLTVGFAGDRDEVYQVQVVADDRLREANGTLQGGANGGTQNQPKPLLTPATPVPATELDYYSARTIPDTLAGNVAASAVTIYASTDNDPATLTVTKNNLDLYEDQVTNIGGQIVFDITDAESDAFGTPVTVTLSVPSGTLNVGSTLPAGIASVGGRGTGTLTVTGTASTIEAFLNSSLTYQSASNVNHDLNGAADGDVTLTVSFSDTGSQIGSGGAQNPAPVDIALTILPVNDPPTVSVSGSGTIVATGEIAVPGFSVGDVDINGDAGGIAAGEADFLQVTVRVTNTNGVPLAANDYANGTEDFITIKSTTAPAGLVVDGTYDGTGSVLVLRGSLTDINTYLAGLTVNFSGPLSNNDAPLQVQVIADDRMRDINTGALTGTAANGGENNKTGGGTQAVPITVFDPYVHSTGQLGSLNLLTNVHAAHRTIFPTSVNDPATIEVPSQRQNEGSATYRLNGIVIADPDAVGSPFDVTVKLDPGFTFAALNGGGALSDGNTTAKFRGTQTQISNWVNNLTVNLPVTDGLATDWNGSFGVTITVDDNGNHGSRPGSLVGDTDDTSSNPGDFDYKNGTDPDLVTTRSFTVTIGAVNDAPVVQQVGGSTETSLGTINEDTVNPAGKTVEDLFRPYFTDSIDTIASGSDSDNFAGVVVNGLATNPDQGVWQYSTDNGASWTEIGARNDATGLYLASDALIRFVPAADFHGAPAKLTVRLAEDNAYDDNPTGPALPASGNQVDVSSGNNGGTTHYSTGTVTLGVTVANVNDRPTISNATLPQIVEDSTNPAGRTVSQLFGDSFGDGADNQSAIAGGGNASTPLGGIAIVGNAADPAQGVWQYHAGSGWVDVSTSLSDASTLLLPPDTLIRFLPAPDYNGTPGGLTVRATDTPVAAIQVGADITGDVSDVAGSTSHWSVTKTLTTSVSPVNDAPVLSGTTLDGATVNVTERDGVNTGTTTVNLVTGSVLRDIDTATTPGLDAGTFGAGRIEVTLGNYAPGDLLTTTIQPAGVQVNTVIDAAGWTLVISLDADTTYAEVQSILDGIVFRNTSDNPTDFGNKTTRPYTIVIYDGVNTDPQGDTAGAGGSLRSNELTGIIRIAAENDPPVAHNNTNRVVESVVTSGSISTATGNVILDAGPDGKVDSDPDTPASELRLVSITSISGGTQAVDNTAPVELVGQYGKLTINADGSYVYTLNNDDPAVNGLKTGDTLSDIFSYVISDGALQSNTATLTIAIDGRTDGTPAITPADVNGPGANGHATVYERGLTDGVPGTGDESTTGTITVNAPDGLDKIRIGNVDVSLPQLHDLAANNVAIDTGEGTLTLTGFTPTDGPDAAPVSGTVTYTYVLKDAVDQPNAVSSLDNIDLSVTDRGGGTSSGTLVIQIIDDVPVAVDDSNAITRGAASDTVTGNVVTSGPGQDLPGADGASVTGVTKGDASGSPDLTAPTDVTPTNKAVVTGEYGTLTLYADGSYSYTLDNTNPTVAALQTGTTIDDVFTYRLTDSDGDFDLATLTITIGGKADGLPGITPADVNGPDANGHATVEERGLPDGSDPASGTDVTGGTIDITAPNGISGISVGGRDISPAELAALGTQPIVITTPSGTLTLTGFTPTGGPAGSPTSGTLTYTYQLDGSVSRPAGGGEVTDPISLTVTDTFNGSSDGTLTIRIVDDGPLAQNDSAAIDKGAASNAITGNVTPNDVAGADGFGPGGAVTGIGFDHDGDPSTPALPRNPGESFATAYGTLVLNADGSYVYTLDKANPAVIALGTGATLLETLTYTITDADGDTSVATLTITINGSDPEPVLPPDEEIPDQDIGTPGELPPAIDIVEPEDNPIATPLVTRTLPVITDWSRENLRPSLEGWPIHRYTTTRQTVMQQVMFRYSGDMTASNLFYEATLGRNQALPAWISFDPYTQTVIALPYDDVEPGVYIVRVAARDAAGNEAVSTVTIHVLQDNHKSFEAIRTRAVPDEPQPDDQPAPGQLEPEVQQPEPQPEATPPQEAVPPESSPETPEPSPDAPETAPPAEPGVQQEPEIEAFLDRGIGRQSLTDILLQSGTSGRTIEMAQLLEALGSEARSTSTVGEAAIGRPVP